MSTTGSSSQGERRAEGPGQPVGQAELSARDRTVVDQIIESGFDPAALDGAHRPAAERLLWALSALEVPEPELAHNRDLLIDLTVARAARSRRTGTLRSAESVNTVFATGDLSAEDDDALEALVEAGMDPARVPASIRRRAVRQLTLLGMLDEPLPTDVEREALVGRTLATIQESIERDESRMAVAAVGVEGASAGGAWARFRLGDLLTAAALILIGFGVIVPMTTAVQGYSHRAECQAGLSAAGMGFGLYAGSNKDALPLATPSLAGTPWWFVGKDPAQSNAANLYTLVRTGNARLSDLACAGNARAVRGQEREDALDWGCLEEVSFSYQNLFAKERPGWTGPSRTIVLVDRSPVILKAVRGQAIDPMENSPNHGGRGQAALLNDRSVTWLRTPVLENGDNIWLPRMIEQAIQQWTQPRQDSPTLHGTESPEAADDVFVGP